MEPINFLYYVSPAVLCLTYLVGIVAGILLIIRKNKLPGILIAVGFGILGINIVYGVLSNFLWPVLFESDITSLTMVYPISNCAQGIMAFLGMASLLAAIFSGLILKKDTEGI